MAAAATSEETIWRTPPPLERDHLANFATLWEKVAALGEERRHLKQRKWHSSSRLRIDPLADVTELIVSYMYEYDSPASALGCRMPRARPSP